MIVAFSFLEVIEFKELQFAKRTLTVAEKMKVDRVRSDVLKVAILVGSQILKQPLVWTEKSGRRCTQLHDCLLCHIS